MNLRVLAIVPALAVLGLTAQFGCNSSGTLQPGSASDYTISVTAVQDPNINTSRVVAKILRDGDDFAGADLEFDGQALNFSSLIYGFDSIYFFVIDTSPAFTIDTAMFVLRDSTIFDDTLKIAVSDTFRIDTINNPGNHIVRPGNQTVTYTWTASANTQNYVMAAVLADSAYRGYGYSEYLPVIGTSGTLPADAFSVSPNPDLDTGLYNIYVYAINGVPDSALTAKLLPVPLPFQNQFPDNVNTGDIFGRIGTVHVTLIDTVRAQTIP
ncbi:MAG: hypothetical protein ACREBV_01085 [Candidatus Zixiibacteriota bacterium]